MSPRRSFITRKSLPRRLSRLTCVRIEISPPKPPRRGQSCFALLTLSSARVQRTRKNSVSFGRSFTQIIPAFICVNLRPKYSIRYTLTVLLGDLPPGEKWLNYELKALGLRDFARVRIDQPLNPFDLARFANLIVIRFDQVEGLSESAREHLLGTASENWSGGACTLPNGMKLVILNPTHGRNRTNATLMEEICHVFLGHKPTRLSVFTKDGRGKVMSRDYREADEEEAYGVGAAGLVPYRSLKKFVKRKRTSSQIAYHFHVSKE